MASPIVTRSAVEAAYLRAVAANALMETADAVAAVAQSLGLPVEAVEDALFDQEAVESEGGHVD